MTWIFDEKTRKLRQVDAARLRPISDHSAYLLLRGTWEEADAVSARRVRSWSSSRVPTSRTAYVSYGDTRDECITAVNAPFVTRIERLEQEIEDRKAQIAGMRESMVKEETSLFKEE